MANKALLSWYLISLKLKEAVAAEVPTPQTPTPLTRSTELPDQTHQLKYQSKSETDDLPKSEWVINIKDKLEQARQEDAAGSWRKLCIYRVPQYLGDGDDKAYIPQTVSLGPFHHGKRRHRNMDRHKWRSLYHILKRTNQDIKLYLDSMKELEERARACYEGTIPLSSNDFVEMMVLDGCFILELFRGSAEGFIQIGYCRNDPVFAMRGSMHSIQRDMIMLENQIPLFVLNRLLGLQFGQPNQKGLVARLALRFFDPLMPTDEPLAKSGRNEPESSIGFSSTFDPLSDQGGLHCLDVFRHSLLHRSTPEPRIWMMRRWSHAGRVADKRRQQLIHCVTVLRESGIKFRKKKTDRFWDVTFNNGTLSIPRLLIHDGTKSLFLNLIAFEQCHLNCSNEITSYVIFMDNLINSAADVAYLHYCGIIEHWLVSDAEVADLFNRLCQEVVFDINDSYLSRMSAEVNRYHNQRWNVWRASLKHNYFNNPWAIISFIAAAILLLLTLAQTICGLVVREEKVDGIVMFADDSNIHSIALFDEIQKVKGIGAVSIGILAHSGNSDEQLSVVHNKGEEIKLILPIQGPSCNSSDQLVVWHPFNSSPYEAKCARYIDEREIVLPRKLEWARFVLNSRLLWKEDEDKLDWVKFLQTVVLGGEDVDSLLSLLKDPAVVEPLGSCGRKVMLWWLRVEARADSKFPARWIVDPPLEVMVPAHTMAGCS